MDKIAIDDSLTSATVMSDRSYDYDESPPRTHRPSFLKKRGKSRSSSFININELPEEEREKAVKFDLDGSGTLDRIELAMMRFDTDGDGNLSLGEIHNIVEEHLKDQNRVGALKKVVAGLTLFVFVLSLSNLGTSLASAILVKETKADPKSLTLTLKNTEDVMGTQSSAETFEALAMDVNTRRARRALVVESLRENPFGEHAHRRLGKSGSSCRGKKCDEDISFDTNYISRDDAEKIKDKCNLGRVVNIKRSFPGGSIDTNNLCKTGASIVVKEKKSPKSKRVKGGGKSKNRISFGMTVSSDGKETVFDCEGKKCFMSGTNLLQKHGEPCNLNHGSDDCEAGLICIQDDNDARSGKCLSNWDKATWYVDWDTYENPMCVQDCTNGPNCGGNAKVWDEKFSTYTLCCDTQLSYLTGGYNRCVPDLEALKDQD